MRIWDDVPDLDSTEHLVTFGLLSRFGLVLPVWLIGSMFTLTSEGPFRVVPDCLQP